MKTGIGKRKVLLIVLMISTLVLFSCKGKEETMIETDNKMPIKVLYRRMWEYGLNVESDDQQIISELLDKISKIKLGEKVNMAVDDYTDLIIFEYQDGTKKMYHFEADIYVEDDDNRYLVVSGLEDVRNILNSMVEGKE